MKKLFTSILTLALPLFIWGQTGAIVSAGDNNTSHHKIHNWTIGSIISGSSHTNNFIVTHGIPSDVYRIIYENKKGELNIKCYPNPATNKFVLELLTNEPQKYRWQLVNTKGVTFQKGKFKSDIHVMNISHLQSSLYLVFILDNYGNRVASAKLLKQ